MPKLRAIVFDLDDTLYPERAYVLSGFRAVARFAEDQLGIPGESGFAELRQLFEDGARGDTFDRWLSRRGAKPESWVARLVQVYRDHRPEIEPYPEIPALLQRLGAHYRLGLLSDGYLEVQQRKVASLQIAPWLDALVFSDEWGRESWKPSPRPFAAVLERLAVAGPEAVYVADNPTKDFLGARRLGIWTIRLRRPGGLYGHLEPPSAEHAPDAEIETSNDLEPALAELTERSRR